MEEGSCQTISEVEFGSEVVSDYMRNKRRFLPPITAPYKPTHFTDAHECKYYGAGYITFSWVVGEKGQRFLWHEIVYDEIMARKEHFGTKYAFGGRYFSCIDYKEKNCIASSVMVTMSEQESVEKKVVGWLGLLQ